MNIIKRIIFEWLRKGVIIVIAVGLGIFAFLQYRDAQLYKDRAEFFKDKYEECLNMKIPP